MIKEQQRFKGVYKITLKQKNKEDTIIIENTVVTSGLEAIAAKLNGDPNSLFQYVVLGTDNTAVALSDTGLGTEVYRKTPDTVTATGAVITLEVNIAFDEANGNTIREIGIIGVDGTGTGGTGTLISRAILTDIGPDYAEIVKVSGLEIDITWELTCA